MTSNHREIYVSDSYLVITGSMHVEKAFYLHGEFRRTTGAESQKQRFCIAYKRSNVSCNFFAAYYAELNHVDDAY